MFNHPVYSKRVERTYFKDQGCSCGVVLMLVLCLTTQRAVESFLGRMATQMLTQSLGNQQHDVLFILTMYIGFMRG